MSEIERLAEAQTLQDREIRRLKLWLSDIAVRSGLRADRIIGIIDPSNLPAGAAGGTFVYVSFGSEPTGGQTFINTVMYSGDLIVKT